MNQSRLEQLLGFYKDDPNDAFTIYALATEYKEIDAEKALYFYELLLKEHPNYVATYYHLAHLYIDLGNMEKAKATFENGIKIATDNKASLAIRELRNAYDEFMMDY